MTGLALVVGEALIDAFPDRDVVAGAPLNVAVRLAARRPTRFVTRVGDDADGRKIIATLEEFGVDTSLVEIDEELPTGRVMVELTGSGHRFVIQSPAAWDALVGPPVPPPSDVVVCGTLVGRAPTSRAALARIVGAAGAASLVACDANLRPPHVDPAAVKVAVGAATLLKMSNEEVPEVARTLGLSSDPAEFFGAYARLRWLCVTRGPDGADLYRRDGASWRVPAPAAEVVDTVGAGDAFFAALVDSLARRESEERALGAAAAAGASAVGTRGGLPPREA